MKSCGCYSRQIVFSGLENEPKPFSPFGCLFFTISLSFVRNAVRTLLWVLYGYWHASKCLGTDTRKPSSPIARSYRFTKFLRCFYDVSNVCFFDFGPGLILHDVTYVGRFCLLILGGRSLGCKHGTFLVFQLSARRGCLHISLQIVAAHWDLETSKVDDFFLCAHLWWRRGHGWRPWTSEASQEIWANAGLWCWHFWERDLRRNQKPASSIPESVE